VQLDARDSTAGTATWTNQGSVGPFQAVGKPDLETILGQPGVHFDGATSAYQGPVSPSSLDAASPRTIEVWAYNPAFQSQEEVMVAWGLRGFLAENISFNWGTSPQFGAVTHYGDDMGWKILPSTGKWHYLVYTYDGTTAKIYDDTILKNTLKIALQTAPGGTVNLGAENADAKHLQWFGGNLDISFVRISTGALTPQQIATNFAQDATRFGAKVSDARNQLLRAGTETYTAGNLQLTLSKATQEAISLSLVDSGFDYLPGDQVEGRLADGFYQLGDITFRVRSGDGAWATYTSTTNLQALTPLTLPNTLAAVDLTPLFPSSCPVQVIREWVDTNGTLSMRFLVKNRTSAPVELGAFGAAMVVNNLFTGLSLNDVYTKCSLADPYIGGDAGYVRMVPAGGVGQVLLVLPEKGTSFEAYRQLADDTDPRSETFEGFYEMMTNTAAYAENEWANTTDWVPPTEKVLPPGGSVAYGYDFVLAPSLRQIESTLVNANYPVAVGFPGYQISTDQTAKLFVHSATSITSIAAEPSDSLRLTASLTPTPHGWWGYQVQGLQAGEVRVRIQYGDGRTQYVHYHVTAPESLQLTNLGNFISTKQWFTDQNDPFHRADSFLNFNLQTNSQVLQNAAVWMAGLSDEMGAAPSVAMATKNLVQPDAEQIAQLEKYVSTALWGDLQNTDYTVKRSLFYYDPSEFPNYYTITSGWPKSFAYQTDRPFNYVHVTTVYWSLYRIGRYHPSLLKLHTWDWYLNQAYNTAIAQPFSSVGLMNGSLYADLLADLKREGWNTQATTLQNNEHEREKLWAKESYPFASEFPWDSTGQEEVYSWSQYFGDNAKADLTLNTVLAYMPLVPNWAYNGAARRYFDEAVNNTEWPDIMRITNHYGSGINSVPVLDRFRRTPTDSYLLRVGYAGMDQLMANIDDQGFGSVDFDCDPAIRQFDSYTGDYGIGFADYIRNAGAYVIYDPEFGWQGFGGDVDTLSATRIKITPRNGPQQRVFIAPSGLWITLDAGRIASVTWDTKTASGQIILAGGDRYTPNAYLRFNQVAIGNLPGKVVTAAPYPIQLGAYVVPNTRGKTIVIRSDR
jgi:hypothetical protein